MPGTAKRDQATLRSLSALIASLPASENPEFRQEFDTVRPPHYSVTPLLTSLPRQEYEDVQLTAYLSALTKSVSILNDVRLVKPAHFALSDSALQYSWSTSMLCLPHPATTILAVALHPDATDATPGAAWVVAWAVAWEWVVWVTWVSWAE